MNSWVRRVSQSLAGVAMAGALLLSGGDMMSAHVTIDANETAAGSYALLTVAFSHGCEGSPTTQVSIAVPEEIETIRPGMNYGWTVEKVSASQETPDADDGADSDERVSEIVYTAKEPVPDGFYDQFLLQVKLPDGAEGKTIAFPVVQTCEDGETAWVQVPAEGQDADDLENPAPSITVTAAKEAGHQASSGSPRRSSGRCRGGFPSCRS